MLEPQASVVIDRSPDVILDWIADLDRYRRADRKITAVLHQGGGTVRYRGRLRGIPTPVDEQTVHVEPARSLTFRGAPRWTRRLLDFEGGFRCEPVDGRADRTLVEHAERYEFKPAPLRWVAEAYLRRWLQRDIEAEVVRLKQLVEATV